MSAITGGYDCQEYKNVTKPELSFNTSHLKMAKSLHVIPRYRDDLLYVHFKGSGDVRWVQLVPAAVEAFRIGVGSTGDCGLPRGNYREKKTRKRARRLAHMYSIK